MTTEKSNTGMRVLTVLLAVLLVVAGVMVFKLYNQEKETKAQLMKEKEIVLNDLNDMVVKYDEVIEENNLVNTDLNAARERVQILIDSVEVMKADISVLRKYQNQVSKLNSQLEYLFAQNDSLRGRNSLLALRVNETKEQLEVSNKAGDSLANKAKELETVIAKEARLSVVSLKSNAVIERRSGRLVENDNANRVDIIRTCFTVPTNRLAESGDKVLFVQVKDPSGNVMGANQTITVDGEEVTYSKISRFYYENKPLDVCENIKKSSDNFAEGKYTVNVFNGTELLSTTSFTLD